MTRFISMTCRTGRSPGRRSASGRRPGPTCSSTCQRSPTPCRHGRAASSQQWGEPLHPPIHRDVVNLAPRSVEQLDVTIGPPKRRYQRTASTITSDGKRSQQENADHAIGTRRVPNQLQESISNLRSALAAVMKRALKVPMARRTGRWIEGARPETGRVRAQQPARSRLRHGADLL